jgi:hypothetical protein
LASAENIPPQFARYVAREQKAQRFPGEAKPLPPGTVTDRLFIKADDVARLSIEAAKRAAGFFRPTRRTEFVWVSADSELAVGMAALGVQVDRGRIIFSIPVRSDQTGPTEVHVTFAVGEPGRPAGLYAATQRRPRGPALIVDTWGDAIVAYAWQVLLELVAGLAGATGKDTGGNRLVPVELEATPKGLAIVPMARHRFSGSTGISRGR